MTITVDYSSTNCMHLINVNTVALRESAIFCSRRTYNRN